MKDSNSIDKPITTVMTVAEAAAYLKVSKFTIKRWLRAGKLQGCKLAGNRWRVFKEACDKLITDGSN
jgi:excisionase family DNA binding protein